MYIYNLMTIHKTQRTSPAPRPHTHLVIGDGVGPEKSVEGQVEPARVEVDVVVCPQEPLLFWLHVHG